MKNGVPWDVAWSLPDADALGYAVALGEIEGVAVFDWGGMRWVKRSGG